MRNYAGPKPHGAKTPIQNKAENLQLYQDKSNRKSRQKSKSVLRETLSNKLKRKEKVVIEDELRISIVKTPPT